MTPRRSNMLFRSTASRESARDRVTTLEVVEGHHRFKKDAQSDGNGYRRKRSQSKGKTKRCLNFDRHGDNAPASRVDIGMHALRIGDRKKKKNKKKKKKTIGRAHYLFAALGEGGTRNQADDESGQLRNMGAQSGAQAREDKAGAVWDGEHAGA